MHRGYSPAPSLQPNVRQRKRGAFACDHCRAKRLKCARQSRSSSCTNCVLYDKSCESNGLVLKSASETRSQRTSTPAPFSRPVKPHVGQKEELEIITPSFNGSEDDVRTDPLERQMLRLLIPIFIGVIEDVPYPSVEVTQNKLPMRNTVERYMNMFIGKILPSYPIIDEDDVQILIERDWTSEAHRDPLSRLLLHMMICNGSLCCSEANSEMEESQFAYVLAHSYLVFDPKMDVKAVQTLFLMSLYCWHTERHNGAWNWLSWAIRLLPAVGAFLGGTKKERDICDRLKGCTFVLQGQVSLAHFRNEPQLQWDRKEAQIEIIQSERPVFALRLRLARLVHQFSTMKAGCGDPIRIVEQLEVLLLDTKEFKESVPLEWRPDHDVFAEQANYQKVLIMHLEYHTFLMAVFTTLGALPHVLRHIEHSTGLVDFKPIEAIINARRILQVLQTIATAPHFEYGLLLWISPSHILAAFRYLYLHVMARPRYVSAHSDLQLLHCALEVYQDRNFASTHAQKLTSLMKMMYQAASSLVHDSKAASGSITTMPSDQTNGSSDLQVSEAFNLFGGGFGLDLWDSSSLNFGI